MNSTSRFIRIYFVRTDIRMPNSIDSNQGGARCSDVQRRVSGTNVAEFA